MRPEWGDTTEVMGVGVVGLHHLGYGCGRSGMTQLRLWVWPEWDDTTEVMGTAGVG